MKAHSRSALGAVRLPHRTRWPAQAGAATALLRAFAAKLAALALLAAAAGPALAQDDGPERARIERERAAAEAKFSEAQKACWTRFAVTDCVNKATRERNATLAELRRQERVLNEAERKRRSAERQRDVDERSSPERQKEAAEKRARALEEQKEREARNADKAARRSEDDAERARRGPRAEKTPDGPPGPQGKPRGNRTPKSNAPTPEEAAKNRAAYEERLRAAEQHKAEVAARIAKRARPAASDLPRP